MANLDEWRDFTTHPMWDVLKAEIDGIREREVGKLVNASTGGDIEATKQIGGSIAGIELVKNLLRKREEEAKEYATRRTDG